MSDGFRVALQEAWKRIEQRQWVYGKMGRLNANGTYTFIAPGRPTFVYVTLRVAAGGQTVIEARNDAGVPHAPKLNVKMKLEYGDYVIHGKSGRQDLGANPVSDPSGVETHTHAHTELTAMDAVDDHAQYHNDTRGDERYFTKLEYVDESAGVADAGKPVFLAPDGFIDSTMLDPDDLPIAESIDAAVEQTVLEDTNRIPLTDTGVLKWVSWATIKSILTTLFDTLYDALGAATTAVATHAGLTSTHGVTGDIVGTGGAQTLTSKTLTTPVIGDFTNAAHDHGDADDGGAIVGYIKADGTVILTADWDIGEDRRILAEVFQARDGEGIAFATDDGVTHSLLQDDGTWLLGVATSYVKRWVQSIATVGIAQTVTIDITGTTIQTQYALEITATFSRSATNNTPYGSFISRALWRVNTSVATDATIQASDLTWFGTNDGSNNVTITGPIAIPGGIRYTVVNSSASRTMTRNMFQAEVTGVDADDISISVVIA